MAQNIYDDADFFRRYSQIARQTQGLAGAPEWPTLESLLPSMAGARVLDLGCGFGWFSRWAVGAGAGSVVGVDLSERMLARARSETTDSRITYLHADLDNIEFERANFDLAFSSLTLHYVRGLSALFDKVHGALRSGGRLVFSAEHPILLAPSSPDWRSFGTAGDVVWPLNRYLEEGPRAVDWLGSSVEKQHRTVATYLNSLIRTGFTIRHVEEWGPSLEQVRERPEWAVERNRPYFLLVAAQRS